MKPGNDELLFLPLGGTGEIGMNLNLYGHASRWLMIDLGVTFGEDGLPGIDVVMPDPSFIEDRKKDLCGLVLTHAHEDHIGAVPYLWPDLDCPIYATPFTAALLRRKFADEGLPQPPITEVPLSGRFEVGPFEIELITLTHSIPEPNAVVLRTRLGAVLHTGDWKLDPDPLIGESYDEKRLRELSEEGVLAMICDSTNALVPGESGSELDVREGLDFVVGELKNRVAVACFASNVARLETVMRVAEKHGRRVCLVGRSMDRIYAAARETGYLQGLPALIDAADVGYLPREEVLLLCTGSQGEPRAALWRIANDDHRDVVLERGDSVVFSSRVIPGNEKDIIRLHNALASRDIEIITSDFEEKLGHPIHVSGHPARDELAEMYRWVKPHTAIPVHGEPRHLHAHAKLARECQVPHALVIGNGDVVRLAPGTAEVVDHAPAGRLALDGDRLIPTDSAVLRARRKAIFSGSVVVTLVMDGEGRLQSAPVLSALDILDLEDEEDASIAGSVILAVETALQRLPAKLRRQDSEVREVARLAVRRAFQSELGKKPLTDVSVVRIG